MKKIKTAAITCYAVAVLSVSASDTVGRRSSMMQDYYYNVFTQKNTERKLRISEIKNKADALVYIEHVRKKLADSFGAFPGKKSPLNPRITGQLHCNGILIDKVVFESRPGFEVSGLFYRPVDVKGKIPAILALCGHSLNGKASELYQKLGQSLAFQGYAVLMIDPIGQGDRTVKDIWPGTYTHNMVGKQLELLGENLANYRVYDALRAIDYLLTRNEVDPAHIGVTGTSGGGTLSAYVSAFDRRLTMAAPSSYITTMRYNLGNEMPVDAEQTPPRFIAMGLDIADFLIAAAPRPTVILAQDNDFFDPRGAVEVYEELKKIYMLLGKPENISLYMGHGDHGYSAEHRIAAVKLFKRCTGIGGNEPQEFRIFSNKELDCAVQGKNIFDLIVEKTHLLRSKKKCRLLKNCVKRLNLISRDFRNTEYCGQNSMRKSGYAVLLLKRKRE